MNANDYLFRIKQIDSLVRTHATGTPDQLAFKLHISRRTLFTYIKEMKNIGLPISYSKELQSYIYTKQGVFMAGFKEVIANDTVV